MRWKMGMWCALAALGTLGAGCASKAPPGISASDAEALQARAVAMLRRDGFRFVCEPWAVREGLGPGMPADARSLARCDQPLIGGFETPRRRMLAAAVDDGIAVVFQQHLLEDGTQVYSTVVRDRRTGQACGLEGGNGVHAALLRLPGPPSDARNGLRERQQALVLATSAPGFRLAPAGVACVDPLFLWWPPRASDNRRPRQRPP